MKYRSKATFRVACKSSNPKPASRFQKVVSTKGVKQEMRSALYYGETLFVSCDNDVVVELDRKGSVIDRYSLFELPTDVAEKLDRSLN